MVTWIVLAVFGAMVGLAVVLSMNRSRRRGAWGAGGGDGAGGDGGSSGGDSSCSGGSSCGGGGCGGGGGD